MAESESQFWPILYVGAALDCYFQARDDVYVVGNLMLYYQEGEPGSSVSPDLMVVFGAPKHIRSSYRLWEEPKAPDFVLEIASEGTHRMDRGDKRDIYAGMGVVEYWQCDPAGGYLDPPLQGFRLVEGRYTPAPVVTVESGMLMGRSEVLGLELRLTPSAPVREALRFYDPVRGESLRSLREEQAARQALETEVRELRQRGR